MQQHCFFSNFSVSRANKTDKNCEVKLVTGPDRSGQGHAKCETRDATSAENIHLCHSHQRNLSAMASDLEKEKPP